MTLSRQTKESIKTALAITISYAIALSMNWDNPHWAGLAVALISLSTVGQSINKGVLRMTGTIIAAIAAFIFIGIFPQERWLFFILLTIYAGISTYMMLGTRAPYMWNMCALVCVIICVEAATGKSTNDLFYTTMLRAQETGLGVLVYSLITVLLWPNNSNKGFKTATVNLQETQLALYNCYVDIISGKGKVGSELKLQQQITQVKTQFDQLLLAAQTDTYEVSERKQSWRYYQQLTNRFLFTLERWHESLLDARKLELDSLAPDLKRFEQVIKQRLEQMLAMSSGKETLPAIERFTLNIADEGIEKLTHIQRATLIFCLEQLQQLEQISYSLWQTMQQITNDSDTENPVETVKPDSLEFFIDKDRLVSALRVMLTMWLSYFVFIYVSGIPGGAKYITIASVFALVMAGVPQASVAILCMPIALSVAFAIVVYVFVLPELSSFYELGALLFIVTFVIGRLLSKPQQALAKTFGITLLLAVIGISNTQTYSILTPLTVALIFPLAFVLLAITHHFPYPPYPEHAFMRLLKRFFHNARYLVHEMGEPLSAQQSALQQWGYRWHKKELSMVPEKLAFWSKFIKANALQNMNTEEIQATVSALNKLSLHFEDLLNIRKQPELVKVLESLPKNKAVWTAYLTELFDVLDKDPTALNPAEYRQRFDTLVDNMEHAINDALLSLDHGALTRDDYIRFYRLLAAYRSVSEVVLEYAALAYRIDENEWCEARFA